MKLGFVGVGRHAQKLRDALVECGAEVLAHARKQLYTEPAQAFGAQLAHWQEVVEFPGIDAVVACAPPDVTSAVATRCAQQGMRCLATKPLLWTESPMRELSSQTQQVCGMASTYVDLWRLYSPAWSALKEEVRGKRIESIHVDFYGNGPMREFSGLLDYGPHALAFVGDLLGEMPVFEHARVEHGTKHAANICVRAELTSSSDRRVMVNTGNLYDEPRMLVQVMIAGSAHPYEWHEAGAEHFLLHGNAELMTHHRGLALRSFCRAFLAGAPSDTLRLSVEGMGVMQIALNSTPVDKLTG